MPVKVAAGVEICLQEKFCICMEGVVEGIRLQVLRGNDRMLSWSKYQGYDPAQDVFAWRQAAYPEHQDVVNPA